MKQKIIIISMAILMTGMLANLTLSNDKPSNIKGERWIASSSGLSLRAEPSAKSKRLATVRTAKKVYFLETTATEFKLGTYTGMWAKVALAKSPYTVGYMPDAWLHDKKITGKIKHKLSGPGPSGNNDGVPIDSSYANIDSSNPAIGDMELGRIFLGTNSFTTKEIYCIFNYVIQNGDNYYAKCSKAPMSSIKNLPSVYKNLYQKRAKSITFKLAFNASGNPTVKFKGYVYKYKE